VCRTATHFGATRSTGDPAAVEAIAVVADVTNFEHVAGVADRAAEAHGQLDTWGILVEAERGLCHKALQDIPGKAQCNHGLIVRYTYI
jgi:hypothetical protein